MQRRTCRAVRLKTWYQVHQLVQGIYSRTLDLFVCKDRDG